MSGYRDVEVSACRYIVISNGRYLDISVYRYIEGSVCRDVEMSLYRYIVISKGLFPVKSQKNQVFSVKVCVCEINVVILHAFSAHYDLKQ